MTHERRTAPRSNTDVFVNKILDGIPHVVRLLDISRMGCLVERVLEPEIARPICSFEMQLPASMGGSRMFLWARPVWSNGVRTAYRFVGTDTFERHTLDRLTRSLAS